jgi:hypothetical protein
MSGLFSKRFKELLDQASAIEKAKTRWYDPYDGKNKDQVDENDLLSWKTKARHLLVVACGDSSEHFRAFQLAEPHSYGTNLDVLHRTRAVMLAAQEDYDGGFFAKVQTLVQADLFDSELEQASELLRSGFTLAAAVIAGVVLETTVRELCSRNNVPYGKLDKMNADLAKAGVYNGIVQKRITHLAAVRNSAAHGNDAEFRNYDVKAMIDEVEQFLATHLS